MLHDKSYYFVHRLIRQSTSNIFKYHEISDKTKLEEKIYFFLSWLSNFMERIQNNLLIPSRNIYDKTNLNLMGRK